MKPRRVLISLRGISCANSCAKIMFVCKIQCAYLKLNVEYQNFKRRIKSIKNPKRRCVNASGFVYSGRKRYFAFFVCGLELSHRKLQYKTPEKKEREYALKDAGL